MGVAPGDIVDRYLVLGVLGEGGMATVYKARHRELGSMHAMKVLTRSSDSVRRRLLQEGRIQATMRHYTSELKTTTQTLPDTRLMRHTTPFSLLNLVNLS